MKVSEKSLELNLGAELLGLIRNSWGMSKTYLRGLTQREESQEGADFFVQLDPTTRLFAFQFKAPRGLVDAVPYRYTLMRDQHNLLFQLSQLSPDSAFYVFPFYVTATKLHQYVPHLMNDTWLLNVDQMPTLAVFGGTQSKIVRCWAGRATINPEYEMRRMSDVLPSRGVPAQEFALWYRGYRESLDLRNRRSPWLVRGLRVAIVMPGG
ncbi:MAG: hypothetical protein ACREKR_01415 [Candidatus Methylomirabilales bacterium]